MLLNKKMLYIIIGIFIVLLVIIFRKGPNKYEVDINYFEKTIHKLENDIKQAIKGGYGYLYSSATKFLQIHREWINNGKPKLFLLKDEYDNNRFKIIDKDGYEYNVRDLFSNKNSISKEQVLQFMTNKDYIKYKNQDNLIVLLSFGLIIALGLYLVEIIFNINFLELKDFILNILDSKKLGNINFIINLIFGLIIIYLFLILLKIIDFIFDTSFQYYLFQQFINKLL